MRLTVFERTAVVLAAAAALAMPVGAWGQQETENFNQTVAFPAGGTLDVRNFSGLVQITGTSGSQLVIKAIRRADRATLDRIKIEVRPSSTGVTIEANRRPAGDTNRDNDVVDTDFEIQVPAAARLNVEVFSSELDIRGISGEQRLKTFSGNIVLDATAAGATPRVRAETFSGSIRARLAESAKADVNFESFSGRFDSDLPVALRSSGGRGRSTVSGTLSGGGSELDFHTFSGSVRIVK